MVPVTLDKFLLEYRIAPWIQGVDCLFQPQTDDIPTLVSRAFLQPHIANSLVHGMDDLGL